MGKKRKERKKKYVSCELLDSKTIHANTGKIAVVHTWTSSVFSSCLYPYLFPDRRQLANKFSLLLFFNYGK